MVSNMWTSSHAEFTVKGWDVCFVFVVCVFCFVVAGLCVGCLFNLSIVFFDIRIFSVVVCMFVVLSCVSGCFLCFSSVCIVYLLFCVCMFGVGGSVVDTVSLI